MPKFFLAIYLLLILCGCSNREKAVPAPNYGNRYFINKVVFIDESTAGIISIPEACEYQFSRQRELMSLNIPQTEWHNYMKTKALDNFKFPKPVKKGSLFGIDSL